LESVAVTVARMPRGYKTPTDGAVSIHAYRPRRVKTSVKTKKWVRAVL
jgi:hypothetical protein